MIINAHNFTPDGPDFSVNGKTPLAVWCPSLDDVGNGTTTLTDLQGAVDGTLTNFALTGSSSNWIADTGAGGVRSVDHDGVNDYVGLGSSVFFPTGNFAISWWEKIVTAGVHAVMAFKLDASSSLIIYRISIAGYTYLAWRKSSGAALPGLRASNASNPTTVVGQWRHFVLTGSSAASGTAGDFTVFENGSALTITTAADFQATTFVNSIGRDGLGTFNRFRWDDTRLFSDRLDISDASYLYNSGSGRGRS